VSHAGVLDVRDLVLRFAGQEHALLTTPSLQLAAGSSLGLRGVSGAGKTTLLHCLAGIARPASGHIFWGDSDICALHPDALDRWRHRHLGLIFQDFHLIDGLSVLDNVLLPAYFDRWTPAGAVLERARELLAAVGIETFDRLAAVLSRGERQRVAFARALLLHPAILMADEPTASLDPDHRNQLGELLVAMARSQGATLIVISHEQELLTRMDRCVTLHQGCLNEDTAHPAVDTPAALAP
jgi:putative ABC transport system ATP-binding protein